MLLVLYTYVTATLPVLYMYTSSHSHPTYPVSYTFPSGGSGETVEEILMVHGKPIKLYQQEGAFSQPNAKVREGVGVVYTPRCCVYTLTI